MKKSSGKGQGNKGNHSNTVKSNAPVRHDDQMRRQPPTPQDIARVQPISQTNHNEHPGHETNARGGKNKK